MNAQWVLKRSGNPGPILGANTKNHWDRQWCTAKIQRTNLFQWIVRFLYQVQRGPGNPLVYLTSEAPWQSSWFSRRMSRVRRGRGIVTRRTSVKTILVKLVTFGESPPWPFPIDLTHSRAAAGHTLLPPTVEYYWYTLLYTICIHTYNTYNMFIYISICHNCAVKVHPDLLNDSGR